MGVAFVVVVLASLGSRGHLRADIGDAAQVVRAGSGTARISETVRYDDDHLRVEASDRVVGGRLESDLGAVGERDEHLWSLVSSVWPVADVARVRQLNLVTDGVNGTLAMVHRSTMDPSTWIVSLDPAEPDDVLRRTLVHELAHVHTLGREDLTVVRADERCDGVRLVIGCARSGSTLAAWAEAFWSDHHEPATDDRGRFVTAYAASSVPEDLAESFMVWTVGPGGSTRVLAADKAAFFAARPELVQLRADVRAKLGLDGAAA